MAFSPQGTATPVPVLDCLIIGAGPAGLSAALYLARFQRKVEIVDDGNSRARWIPSSRNIVFFGEGIAGEEILHRGRRTIERYGITPTQGKVVALARNASGFQARIEGADRGGYERSSRFVLLATGAEDTPPEMPDLAKAVGSGLVRYCPVCDGFEASDRCVAVLGRGASGCKEAEFLVRSGFSQVTLLSLQGELELAPEKREALLGAGVNIVAEPVVKLEMQDKEVIARTSAGAELRFETVYAALGLKPRCGLALGLGAKCDGHGALIVDPHYETSVPGLYAAGDVVAGLSQVVVAMSHAAVAATAIHNRLPRARPKGRG